STMRTPAGLRTASTAGAAVNSPAMHGALRPRERWEVKVEDDPDLRVQGNVVDHEYTIERDGQPVAEMSKRWFRVRDSCGVEGARGETDILTLAPAAVIDTMAHPAR